MRLSGLVIGLAISTLTWTQPMWANCLVIDQLDKLHALQSRLARDPDTGLFATDIRQLRVIISGLSNADTLDAVDGNSFTGHGADFIRFLQNTNALLQSASLDDPQSIRPHFTRAVRANLSEVSTHLTGLRCNRQQIAVDAAAAAEGSSGGDSDAEDLAEVAETLSRLAEEVLQVRSLVVLVAIGLTASIVTPLLQKWLILRKRRAKRHNTAYETQYKWDEGTTQGMLIDINCYGSKLRHEEDRPVPQGASIEIAIGETWAEGSVVWSNTHYSGVQFKRLISLADVDIVRGKVAKKKASSKTQNGAAKGAV